MGAHCSGTEFPGCNWGRNVCDFKEGDRIIAATSPSYRNGAWGQFATVKYSDAAPVPSGIESTVAAAFPYAALSGITAISKHVHDGSRVLVQGGSGGVGHLVVQWCKQRGAEVHTTCSEWNTGFCLRCIVARAISNLIANKYTRCSCLYPVVS